MEVGSEFGAQVENEPRPFGGNGIRIAGSFLGQRCGPRNDATVAAKSIRRTSIVYTRFNSAQPSRTWRDQFDGQNLSRIRAVRSRPCDAAGRLSSLGVAHQRTVRRETNGGVQDLNVRIDPAGIFLQGRCCSFYCKQLAQTAAMRLGGGASIINEIEVAATDGDGAPGTHRH